LIEAGIDECNAQVDRCKRATLGAGSSGQRLSTQLDCLVGVTLVAADDAKDTAGHPPRRGIVVGSRDDIEDLCAPVFRLRVVARHQLCLSETSEHRGGLGALIT
jgi:hypothetical protein